MQIGGNTVLVTKPNLCHNNYSKLSHNITVVHNLCDNHLK